LIDLIVELELVVFMVVDIVEVVVECVLIECVLWFVV